MVKVYVCVLKKGYWVVGALFAEKIARVYRMFFDVKNVIDVMEGMIVSYVGVVENVVCGICVVWVYLSVWWVGLVCVMFNVVRARAVFGYVVAAVECVFI